MNNLTSSDDQFLARVKRIIEENIGNEYFSVEDLARNAGLSRSMLHRKLIKLTGKSATDFVTEIRVTKARELLEKNVANVSEISYRVGFSDPSYFTKVFKKYYKILPGDVKKQISEGTYHPVIAPDQTSTAQSWVKSVKPLYRTLIILFACTLIAVVIYYYNRQSRSEEKSIAVLPLQNFTGDPENEYIIDGLHDALIGELGRIESLRVISRTSTLRYRDSNESMKSIARDLDAKVLVEGSVMEAADSLRLLLQVIKTAPRESHMMVGEYQDALQNVLKMQKLAATDIARKMGIRLSDEEKQLLSKSRTVNPETYKYYLRGMYHMNQGSPDSFEKGIRYMLKAIETDPGDPLAYAGLALGYAIQGHGMVTPEGSFRSAAAAAERALRIDPSLDEAYTALALINSYQGWDWPKVKDDFEKALANNPNNAVAHLHFSFYYLLFNEREKALYHANMAATLEPFAAANQTTLAWMNYYYGNYDQAEMHARKALELEEDVPYGVLVLGWTLIRKGDYQEALVLQKKLPAYQDYYKMLTSYAYIQIGQPEKALALLDEMESANGEKSVNPVFRGVLAGMLGYNDRAFELLYEACDHKIFPITYLKIYPGLEGLKKDPRYNILMHKLHLPV